MYQLGEYRHILAILTFILVCCQTVIGQGSTRYDYGFNNDATMRDEPGSRQKAMGETGVVLADDELTVWSNPAGLGASNPRFENGAVSVSFEPFLTAFKLKDLWSLDIAAAYKPAGRDIGGFGILMKKVSYEKSRICDMYYLSDSITFWWEDPKTSPWLDECDSLICREGSAVCSCGYRSSRCTAYADYRDSDLLFAFAYGKRLFPRLNTQHLFGISLKTYRGSPYPGASYVMPIALDIGYLMVTPVGIRFGISVQNIGPRVTNEWEYSYFDEKYDSTITITGSSSDPIPSTGGLGFAYDMDSLLKRIPWFDATISAAYKRIFMVYERNSEGEWEGTQFYRSSSSDIRRTSSWRTGFGAEALFMNTFLLRAGGYFTGEDRLTNPHKRRDFRIGTGLRLFNHFQFDYHIIAGSRIEYQNYGRSYDDRQQGDWGASLSAFNLLRWKESDMGWWRK